jgi:hypothetical protein
VNPDLGRWHAENTMLRMALEKSLENGAITRKRIEESMGVATEISCQLFNIWQIFSHVVREADDARIQLNLVKTKCSGFCI